MASPNRNQPVPWWKKERNLRRRDPLFDLGKVEGVLAIISAVAALILVGFIIGFSFAIFRSLG